MQELTNIGFGMEGGGGGSKGGSAEANGFTISTSFKSAVNFNALFNTQFLGGKNIASSNPFHLLIYVLWFPVF